MTKDLPLTATHWGTYRVETQKGAVTALHGFEEDPDPSPIGPGIIDLLDHPTRVTAPMVRESWLKDGPGSRTDQRGKEAFVEVTWDEVEQLVAGELTRVTQAHGNSAIYAGSYGWANAGRFHHPQSQLKRFLNCIGGFTRSFGTYSFCAAEAMIPHVLGSYRDFMNSSTSWRSIAEAGELVVAFGGMPLKNGQVESGGTGAHVQKVGMEAAKEAGVCFVSISPLRTDTEGWLDADWWPARPGSDVALMLGLAHTLWVEGLADEGFLHRYCTGFDQFLPYLLGADDGQPKDADWAAGQAEVPAEDIVALARRMAESRTMISVSWSLTRQAYGEQPFWAAITLAAMLGQIGLPGGGVVFGLSAENSIGADYRLLSTASVPQGQNAVADVIPVARVTEMLENPGQPFRFNGQDLVFPDIRLVWWAGGNPFHHHQDLNRLARAWTRPETIIVNDWCWTPAAKRADVVLPCLTHLERDDVSFTLRDPYIIAQTKAVEPPALARSDHAIFAGIADRLGVKDDFTGGRSEAEWIQWLYDTVRQSSEGLDLPEWDAVKEAGWVRTPPPEKAVVMLDRFRTDPDAHPLNTPSGKIEIYSETVAGFGYQDCPGHPVWNPPWEWLGDAYADELHLISNQPARKLHSQMDAGPVSSAGKIAGREPVMMNPADAKARAIWDGDVVQLYNVRGAALGVAQLTEDLRQGVVQMSTGAWWDPDETGLCRHGNPNVLTRDQGTSGLGQGPTAHTCLVRVERFGGAVPQVQAFDPPVIKRRDQV